MNNLDLTLKEIERKLQYYCSYQDRCHKEVIEKLKTYKIKFSDLNLIVSNLINENFLNESRFSKSFVRGKFNIKNWGKVRIQNELKKRNISTYNISLGMKEINEKDYHKKLDYIFNKKLSSLNGISCGSKKKKIISFLIYRGWETNLIYERLNQIK